MQNDLHFLPSSSQSSSPEREDGNKLPFESELMGMNYPLPPFIQPEHQPSSPSSSAARILPGDMPLLHAPLPSPPNIPPSMSAESFFHKHNNDGIVEGYGRNLNAMNNLGMGNGMVAGLSGVSNGGVVPQALSSSTPGILNGTAPANDKNLPIVMQTLSVDLLKMALGSKIDILPSLSRPAFIPGDRPTRFRFVLGTEEQNPSKLNENKIIFGQLTHDPGHNQTRVHVHITYPIPDHVRDLAWVDPLHTVFAIGAKLGIVTLNPSDFTVQELTMFPQFHHDIVREIALAQNSPNLVLSGGFDGKVFVTDISRLYVDIQKNEQKSENSLYPCSDVVGSVRWHPTDPFLASCTTDTGTLHIFDIRTDKKRPALIYQTNKKGLYSHDYRDQHTLLLGFGDGQVQVFDSRTRRNVIVFQDPYLKAVGDIRFNRLSKHFAFFGIPEFTLWQYNDNEMRLWTHHSLSAMPNAAPYGGAYKTCGEFLPSNSPAIAVTDRYPYSIFI